MKRALAFGLAVLEAGWQYPWALLFGSWLAGGAPEPLLPWWAVFGVLLVGRAASRAVRGVRSAWQKPTRLGLVVAGLAGAVALASTRFAPNADPGGPILLGGLALWLWWRGLSRGRGPVDFDTVEGAFRLGLLGLVLFVALAAVTTRQPADVEAAAGASVVAFFAASLASLGLARLVSVRETSRARAGAAPPALSRQWLGVMAGVVAAVVLGALALDAVLSFGLIAAVFRPLLSVVGTLLFYLVAIIALPLAFLAQLLIDALRGRFKPIELTPATGEGVPALEQYLRERRAPVELPPGAVAAGEWLALLAVAVVVGVVLYRALDWWREQEDEEDVEEERDSLWRWADFWPLLLGYLRRLRGRAAGSVTGSKREATAALLAAAAPDPGDARAVYRALLTQAAGQGVPRAPGATPREHLPRMAVRLAPDAELDAITRAYEAVRYGDEAPDEEPEVLRARLGRVHTRE